MSKVGLKQDNCNFPLRILEFFWWRPKNFFECTMWEFTMYHCTIWQLAFAQTLHICKFYSLFCIYIATTMFVIDNIFLFQWKRWWLDQRTLVDETSTLRLQINRLALTHLHPTIKYNNWHRKLWQAGNYQLNIQMNIYYYKN